MLPRISIVTATYNRADLLPSAIESVIHQSQEIPFVWEMILVDDGSTDKTAEVVAPYLQQFPESIIYIYQTNKWVWAARNTGIDKISTESDYVIFLDSDDMLRSDFVFQCLKRMEHSDKKYLAGVYVRCEDEYGALVGWSIWEEDIRIEYQDFLRWSLLFELWVCISSEMFLKYKLRFPEDVVTEFVLWCKMWKIIHSLWWYVKLANYAGRIYRRHHHSYLPITKTISKERFYKNALWNIRVLDIIGDDLLKYGYKQQYSDLCFQIAINYLLCHHKKDFSIYFRRSIQQHFSITHSVVGAIWYVCPSAVMILYRYYISRT